MARIIKRRPVFRRPVVRQNCPFCKQKYEPDYKQPDTLAKFINDKGSLLDKTQTGICAKHQRRVTIAVKRARHLALLPFVVQIN